MVFVVCVLVVAWEQQALLSLSTDNHAAKTLVVIGSGLVAKEAARQARQHNHHISIALIGREPVFSWRSAECMSAALSGSIALRELFLQYREQDEQVAEQYDLKLWSSFHVDDLDM